VQTDATQCGVSTRFAKRTLDFCHLLELPCSTVTVPMAGIEMRVGLPFPSFSSKV